MLSIRSDSQLVIAQVKGEYEVKEPLLVQYVWIAQGLLESLDYDLERIPRDKNGWADALASTKAVINNKMII